MALPSDQRAFAISYTSTLGGYATGHVTYQLVKAVEPEH